MNTNLEGRTIHKIIISNIMSLDGYVEGPGGYVMALPMDGFFDEHNLERLRAAETLLLGATTYLGLKGYWLAVADNLDAADLHRETRRRNNEIQKVVVSDSLTAGDTTTIVRRADAHPGRRRAQGPAGQGHPDVREPDAVERPSGRRAR